MFIIIADNVNSQREALIYRKIDLESMLRDLSALSKQNERKKENLESSFYLKSYSYYISQRSEFELKKEAIEKNYNRDKKLVDNNILSPYDFENIKAQYNTAKTSIQIHDDRQFAQWQNEKDNYEVELRDVNTKLLQIDIANKEMIICSPISGVIQTLINVNDGSYVHNGQQIIEISPEGDLLLECYVPPKDIGLLKIGQKCRIQIDAFNYNDWGVITGDLNEVYNDITMSNDKSTYFYKVYCTLDSDYLQLKTGYKGYIKKGMTARTRFLVTRRTCAQLLYDKIDDWLNPILKSEN